MALKSPSDFTVKYWSCFQIIGGGGGGGSRVFCKIFDVFSYPIPNPLCVLKHLRISHHYEMPKRFPYGSSGKSTGRRFVESAGGLQLLDDELE